MLLIIRMIVETLLLLLLLLLLDPFSEGMQNSYDRGAPRSPPPPPRPFEVLSIPLQKGLIQM